MGTLTRRAEDVATVAAFFAGMAAETARQLRRELAPAAPAAPLPRWNAPHHCGDHAEHVHTWRQLTRYGSAVWLVQQCRVCGEPWDVLSDQSDERVIVASVYPVWAVKGCELCTQECQGPECGCPCHHEQITTPDVPSVRRATPDALGEGMKVCCAFHDREPELYPRCGPDEQGGYCCDNCPRLIEGGAGRG